MHEPSDFTNRQWDFINALVGECAGNATQAAITAGYAAPAQQASRMLRNDKIRQAINELFETSPHIAGRNERLCMLTKIARDERKTDLSRIRAMEVMASMQGDLKLKVDMKQEVSVKEERDELKAMIDDIAAKQVEAEHVH